MPVKAGVIRAGARTTRRDAAETFTGVVFQDPVITAEAPSRLGGSVVAFTPGARTAWHSHPVGQTLFCLSGVGRICFKGEKPQVLNPGDTVNIPPDTLHWHGASPDRLFSHLAQSEAGEQGQGTSWGAHVSDTEYAEPATGVHTARRLARKQLFHGPMGLIDRRIRIGCRGRVGIGNRDWAETGAADLVWSRPLRPIWIE